MSARVYGYLVCIAVTAAMAYPFAWPAHRDSFPLSNYPMFSHKRPTPMVTIEYAVGLEPDGTRHHLAPEMVANEEVLQARVVLGRAVRGGRASVNALCRSIAGRVQAEGGELAEVREVRIVTGEHDAVAYLTGHDRVGKERIHGRCPVGLGQGGGK